MAFTNAYVINSGSADETVIDTISDTVVVASIGTAIGNFACTDIPGAFVFQTAPTSNAVFIVDTSSNTLSSTVAVGHDPQRIVCTADNKYVLVCNQTSGTVSVISTSTHLVTATITVGTTPFGICTDSTGGKAYTINQGAGTVSVIDLGTLSVSATVTIASAVNLEDICILPNGSFVYAADSGGSQVFAIDTGSLAVTTIPTGGSPACLVPALNSAHVYCSGVRIDVIDTGSQTSVANLAFGAFPNHGCMSPDDRYCYFAQAGAGTNTMVNVLDTTGPSVSQVTVGSNPLWCQVVDSGLKVYVSNNSSASVSSIIIASNTVGATISVGTNPQSIALTPLSAPPSLTVPKLFIPRKGLSHYDYTDFDIDWRAIERWANSWAPTLFFPNKPLRRSLHPSELTANWVQLELWAQGPARQTMVAGGLGSAWTALLVPRKDSDHPDDLTVNWNTIQLWANSL